MNQSKEPHAESIELTGLNCSSANFEQVFEFLFQKIIKVDPTRRLQELVFDSLPADLTILDLNLIERFGRSVQNVDSLSIKNMRDTKTETRQAMALLVLTILHGPSTPEILRLENLGLETQDWVSILEILLEKNCSSLKDLSLKENEELWDPESACPTMIKQLLTMQE